MSGLQPVFVHGWACGPEIWHPVQAALGVTDWLSLDLGYFKAPTHQPQSVAATNFLSTQDKQPKLFIGHSLGFMWLLSQCKIPEDSRFVGINAFGRFAATQGYEHGVPTRVLQRMQVGLSRNIAQGVNAFRARCHLPEVTETSCQPAALQDGLEFLTQGDVRPSLPQLVQNKSLLVLAGAQDPIVTPALTEAAFPAGVACHWQAQGGHMLPQTHPQFCAEHIRTFL